MWNTMESRTQTDPGFSYVQGNTSPGFQAPVSDNFPAGIYKLAWLDNTLHRENHYIVLQKLAPKNYVVRLWNCQKEQLVNYVEIDQAGRPHYTVKFLVADKSGVVPRSQEFNRTIHPKAIYVDSDMIPNIYAGRLKSNGTEAIGTIKKIKKVQRDGRTDEYFAFFTFLATTGELIESDIQTFEVFCYE